MKSTARNILIFLLAFLGLSAVGGGALIISPSGKLIGGLPLSILSHSPFPDYQMSKAIRVYITG